MHEFLPYAWFEGKCIPFKDAKISIATHALHYGTAAFGGMRAIPNPSNKEEFLLFRTCLLYTSPSPRDRTRSRMPSSA